MRKTAFRTYCCVLAMALLTFAQQAPSIFGVIPAVAGANAFYPWFGNDSSRTILEKYGFSLP